MGHDCRLLDDLSVSEVEICFLRYLDVFSTGALISMLGT